MTLHTYAIRSASGVRIVNVPESDAHLQPGPGETVAPATEQDHADMAAARDQIKADLAALRAEPAESAVILEAAKTLLTPAQLEAARAKIVAKSKTPIDGQELTRD